MQLLLEVEVRQLTLGALQQFNLDVEECERKGQNHSIHCFTLGSCASIGTGYAGSKLIANTY